MSVNIGNVPSTLVGATVIETQTLAATAQTITFSGLDGNVDLRYRIEGSLRSNSIAGGINLLINGVSTNQKLFEDQIAGDAGTRSITGDTRLFYMESGAAINFFLEIECRTGARRMAGGQAWAMLSPTQIPYKFDFSLMWNETATNITSLAITGPAANCFAANTRLTIKRLRS